MKFELARKKAVYDALNKRELQLELEARGIKEYPGSKNGLRHIVHSTVYRVPTVHNTFNCVQGAYGT